MEKCVLFYRLKDSAVKRSSLNLDDALRVCVLEPWRGEPEADRGKKPSAKGMSEDTAFPTGQWPSGRCRPMRRGQEPATGLGVRDSLPPTHTQGRLLWARGGLHVAGRTC